MKVLAIKLQDINEVNSLIESLNGKFELTVGNKNANILEQIESDEFDLLVLSVSDLDKKLSDLLLNIRSDFRDMPVLCLLDTNEEKDALAVLNSGASEVLLKSDLNKANFEKIAQRVCTRTSFKNKLSLRMSDFVLENSFDGICAIDLNFQIMFWSRSMERMFLKKSEQAIGVGVEELMPFNSVKAELERAIKGESFAGTNKVFTNRDQRRVYQPFYSPFLDTAGDIKGVMAIFRDLTELVEKDKLNFVIGQRLEAVAETVPQMLWFANSKGEKNFFNKKFEEFLGSKSFHLMNEGWLMAVRPDQRAMYQKAIADAVKHKRGFHIEYQMRNNENVYRRIMDSSAPITSDDGTFLGLIGHSTDLSETGITIQKTPAVSEVRSFSEARSFSESSGSRRRLQRNKISSTMENAPLGMWKIDKDLKIMNVSRAAASQLECTPSDLQGRKFKDFIENISEESLLGVMEDKSSFQLNAHRVELNGLRGNKTCYWDIAAWPLLDKSKDVIGVCISTIEVEERSVDKGREAFVATLVHDLKTPLIGADRTLEQLIDGSMGEVDTGQSEVLAMLQKSNRGLLRMVHNLIEVHRFDFKEPKLDFVSTSLFDLAVGATDELQSIAEEKSVELKTNLLSGHGIVLVDELSIKRVIVNLIDNAIKFTPVGGTVKVWGEETPNTVTLLVEDSGVGIKQSEISKVFDKFWRSPSSSGYAVGTGLGLYLCKQIIDSHHGEISVVPAGEKGTLAKITLQT